MREKNGFRTIIDKEKLSAKKKVILVEAHPDDAALAEGLDVTLARKGVGVIIVTFTDGRARFGGANESELIERRRKESIKSAEISGAGMVLNLGYPDGALSSVEPEAIDSFGQVIADLNPDFVIAPHEFDEHIDHASAFSIAKKTMNGSLPLYAMDTISRTTSYGETIVPTHYFPLSESEKRIRDDAYLAHGSQVSNLPPHEYKAVKDVLDLPNKRGQEIKRRHAGIVVRDMSSNADPIAEILGRRR